MMVLSRLWYVVLAILLGIACYVVFLAVGEYDRRNGVAMEEELASDSQTVGWALQIDARKRLDALLIGAVEKGVQDSLQLATGKDTIPGKAKEDGRRALNGVLEKIPADFRPDVLFEVDHDGRVVAQVGFDGANAFPDFELGGYPAVFDALHGYLRDDTWVLGGKPYRVVARPVEADSTQPPLGAIVALRAVDRKFAQEISKRTRANVAFFAGGLRIATASVTGFDETRFTAVDSDMATLASDKSYADGRSELHAAADNLGAIYARFLGDAWDLGAGFVVVRARTSIGGPLGFLNGADDKDKQSVNIGLIAAIVVLAIAIGLILSVLEQTLPLRQMEKQAGALRRGELDYLQVARFRGAYRGIAENLNAGIERVLEKGGGAVRKPADLESILGPVPAQPAMSAFSFPLPDAAPAPPRPAPGPFPGAAPFTGPGPAAPPAVSPMSPASPLQAPPQPPPQPPPPGPPPPHGGPPAPPARLRPLAAPGSNLGPPAAPSSPGAPPPQPPPPAGAPSPQPGGGNLSIATVPQITPVGAVNAPRASNPAFPPAGPPIPPPVGATPGRPGNFQIALDSSPDSIDGDGPTMASGLSPTGLPMPPGLGPPAPTQEHTLASAGMGAPRAKTVPDAPVKLGMGGGPPGAGRPAAGGGIPTHTMMGIGLQAQAAAAADNLDQEDESTVIARAPSELLAAASGPAKAVSDETAEWMSVYDEFLRTKKQCEESTEGLSFDKFQNTLRKNRDALVQRHQCKRVRFSVYIKDGRASLKATPVKE